MPVNQNIKEMNIVFDSLWKKMILGAAICLLLGTASGLSTTSEIGTWYQTINKPTWNPPSWIFGPMWTTLYVMIGCAIGRIWHQLPSDGRKTAIGIFIAQFVLNLAWSPVFFGLHQIGLALIIILTLVLFIILTIKAFNRLDKVAALLMIPYLLWVSFASFLNYTIYTLN